MHGKNFELARTNNKNVYQFISPLGPIEIHSAAEGISKVHFIKEAITSLPLKAAPIELEAAKQLLAYFNGELKHFEIPLDPKGTEFQKKVWTELSKIKYGHTLTYMQLAQKLGNPKVIRAAATANGANPVAIIIPCHRVIGQNGDLTGYAWGLDCKKALLTLEGALAPELF